MEGKIKLSESIEYSDASIVSKTIIKKSGGNVTLFAFDKGQELSEHTAPFEAMIQVVDGQAEISLNRVASLVAVGEIIMLPANIPHAVKAIERFKMMLVMVKEPA